MIHHHLGNGRYVLRAEPGEELIAVFRQFASEVGAGSGNITGLGSVSQAVLGFLDPDTGEYVKRRFEEPMEVANLTGTLSVASEDGAPFVHLHAVLSPRELLAYGGHVHEARVGLIVEAYIDTFDAKITRHAVQDKPFPWPCMPGEAPPEPETDPAGGAEPA